MSEPIVIGYPDEGTAGKALELQKDYLIDLDEARVDWRPELTV